MKKTEKEDLNKVFENDKLVEELEAEVEVAENEKIVEALEAENEVSRKQLGQAEVTIQYLKVQFGKEVSRLKHVISHLERQLSIANAQPLPFFDKSSYVITNEEDKRNLLAKMGGK